MKNLVKLLGIIVLAAVIGFAITACSNGGDDGDSSDSSDISGNNGSAINPQGANVYLGEDSSFPAPTIYADVYMYIEGDDFEMLIPTPIGKITNGKLSFTLPDVSAYADNGYLLAEEFFDYSEPEGYTETGEYGTTTVTKNTMEVNIPQDAKALVCEIGFSHEGKEYWLGYGNETTVASPFYVNKPGTLKGEFTEVYNSYTITDASTNHTQNCTFTAGWNVIYTTWTDINKSTYTHNMSTNPPANAANMRWIASIDALR